MYKQPLVSIIIPTHNRAHLIGETLDSILAQSYTNWECLIIDDGSTDNSEEVYQYYQKKDARFSVFYRPNTKPKGANACRNIGLKKAIGDYVVFFDSDDLMTPNHLQVKVDGIKKYKTDYVITRTKFFNHDNTQLSKNYRFDEFKITPYNYVTQNINWLTYDCCIEVSIAKSISFNEDLQSGQEYNYFCKLVYKSVNAEFVDKVVTLRRKHEGSIRAKLKVKSELNLSVFTTFWLTYLEVKSNSDVATKQFQLKYCANLVYEERKILTSNKVLFCLEFAKVLKVKSIYFFLMLISLKCFGKGFYFRQKIMTT